MSTIQLEARLRSIVADHLGKSEADIRPEASLIEDLDADSLDLVELMMNIEEAFDIEIPDDEAENLRTFKELVDYVAEHILPAA
jgi:acyl carrier protein